MIQSKNGASSSAAALALSHHEFVVIMATYDCPITPSASYCGSRNRSSSRMLPSRLHQRARAPKSSAFDALTTRRRRSVRASWDQ